MVFSHIVCLCVCICTYTLEWMPASQDLRSSSTTPSSSARRTPINSARSGGPPSARSGTLSPSSSTTALTSANNPASARKRGTSSSLKDRMNGLFKSSSPRKKLDGASSEVVHTDTQSQGETEEGNNSKVVGSGDDAVIPTHAAKSEHHNPDDTQSGAPPQQTAAAASWTERLGLNLNLSDLDMSRFVDGWTMGLSCGGSAAATRRTLSMHGIEVTYYKSVSNKPVPFSLAAEVLGLSSQVRASSILNASHTHTHIHRGHIFTPTYAIKYVNMHNELYLV